ncbi:S1 family peptidase [Spirillospora sp. NBC_00431]
MKIRSTCFGGPAAGALAVSGLLAAALVAAPPAGASHGAAGAPVAEQAVLAKVMDALRRDATVPGTAWAADPAAGQVVLTMDGTVKGTKLKKVKAAAAKHGAAVRTERVAGTFREFALGGDPILTSGSRCTLGFNVKDSAAYYFLTAGHCTNIGPTWTDPSGRTLGTRQASSFPGNDFGLVRYLTPPEDTVGGVRAHGQFRDITEAGQPTVGQNVLFTGGTTGTHSGRVIALNQTVNFPEGSVTGLIRCSVCAGPGDSGGPVFAGSTALGLLSGGSSGGCSGGEGTTFFQPVSEALMSLGVDVY